MAPRAKQDYPALVEEYHRRIESGETPKAIKEDFQSRGIHWGTFQNWRTKLSKTKAAIPQETPMSDETPVEVLPGQMDLNATETPTVIKTADTPAPDPVSAPVPSANLPEVPRERTDLLEFHELANIFPMMGDQDFGDLVQDMKVYGLREPIRLYEGKILDGRNRYKACQLLQMPYRSQPYTGDNPLAYVVSLNLARRHLTTGQRSMIATKLATMRQGTRTDLEPSANLPEVSQAQAAEMLQVSERSLRDAKVVEEQAIPEVQSMVQSGELAISTAAQLADAPPAVQQEIAGEVKQGTMKPRDVGKRLSSQRSNGGSQKKKPKTPEPEHAVAPRKRVQDGLFAVLSMVKDEHAWRMLAAMIEILERYAEQHGDPHSQQRMEQALSPLGHLIDEHCLPMPDEDEIPRPVCVECREIIGSGPMAICPTCRAQVHPACQASHEDQEHTEM